MRAANDGLNARHLRQAHLQVDTLLKSLRSQFERLSPYSEASKDVQVEVLKDANLLITRFKGIRILICLQTAKHRAYPRQKCHPTTWHPGNQIIRLGKPIPLGSNINRMCQRSPVAIAPILASKPIKMPQGVAKPRPCIDIPCGPNCDCEFCCE